MSSVCTISTKKLSASNYVRIVAILNLLHVIMHLKCSAIKDSSCTQYDYLTPDKNINNIYSSWKY